MIEPTPDSLPLIPAERIRMLIYLFRGQKVMLDRDLAALYGVPTKVFNQAVKRHIRRFPPDFMFRLNASETRQWRMRVLEWDSRANMGIRRMPLVFTEQGVAMLSSVLNSERAVQVNIAIMRTFVRLRLALAEDRKLANRLKNLEHRLNRHEAASLEEIRAIWTALEQLMDPKEKPARPIGFAPPTDTAIDDSAE